MRFWYGRGMGVMGQALNASKAMRAAGVEEGQSEYTPEQMQVAVMVLDGWIRKAESDAQH